MLFCTSSRGLEYDPDGMGLWEYGLSDQAYLASIQNDVVIVGTQRGLNVELVLERLPG